MPGIEDVEQEDVRAPAVGVRSIAGGAVGGPSDTR
jgi:hypothetical protein